MSTPIRSQPMGPDLPIILVPSTPLDDVFFDMIVDIATLPIRTSTQTEAGALRDDGLSLAVLRRLAIRWCGQMRERGAFPHDELEGLELALTHYTDREFAAMLAGAVIVRRP